MKVKDLIKHLSKANPDATVILSHDSEGNSFSPLLIVSKDNNRYSDGEMGLDHLTKDLKEQGFTEEDLLEGEEAVVLWPKT